MSGDRGGGAGGFGSGGPGRGGGRRNVPLTFSRREVRDLVIAWLALGVAFAIFFDLGPGRGVRSLLEGGFGLALVVSLLTAGVAFLLHELAHKVVAVRFDQIAEFRADYGMLFVAIMGAIIGFIFAAPGAVYHRGRVTDRELGLIAVAGPVTNLALAAVFVPVYLAGITTGAGLIALVGGRGIVINLFLAAFNMLPFGSLDGKTVFGWSKPAFVATFASSAVLAVAAFLLVDVGF